MMVEYLPTTEIFAVAFGLYFIAVGIGIVLDRDAVQRLVTEFTGNVALSYLAGIMAFVVGATIIALHNDWSSRPLAIVVTALGWIVLVKGTLILAFRRQFLGVVGWLKIGPGIAMAGGLGSILLGAALLYVSFKD